SYREATCDFVKLLRLVSAIKGIEKIRFKTSHPKDVSVRLFRTIRDLDNVAKELHLPLQSGSNRILKLMNRGYTARKYTDLIEKCRQLVPGCEITTDLIVGFPQETEADFRKTFELMNKMKFNAAYIFKYSPRPPAKSAFMKDNVPREIKERRHKMLLDLQKKISKKISAVIIMLLAFSFSAGQVFAQSASLKNAETLILKDAYQEAIKECKKILAHHHQATVRSKTYYLLGISLLKEAEYSQAREKFQAILKQFSRSEFCDDARLGTADSYFLAGDFKQAGKEYERLLQDFPRSELREIAREQQKLCKEGKGASNSYFSVQAGCFTNKTNAEKLRDELIDSGYRAYLLKLPGDNFSRVRIGKFSNRLQAEFLEQQLKSDGYSTKVCP
ncbi:MAG: radical SAM protein, partial [Candidatus Omnitrophica bacterium]|nr:radical SAM protein [Candidatus Omnitrophota bacterium]